MSFQITHKDKKTRARTGILTAPNGARAETPAYVIVGTHAEVRCLKPKDLVETGTQIIISNTFHLWQDLGDKLSEFVGLQKTLDFSGVIFTDSGGFQVFSLGFGREHGTGKMEYQTPKISGENLVRITDKGATFEWDGKQQFLNPEKSVQIQEKLGADGIFAFDECTSPNHGFWYNLRAMIRTHRWAKESLVARKRKDQMMYGIVQGGPHKLLRKWSARVIGKMPFECLAVGGSFSRDEMPKVLDWVMPLLPENKPVHLLGIGKPEDLFEGVERGIDTFDCVIPTREARHGRIWTSHGPMDIKKSGFTEDGNLLDVDFVCPILERDNICRKDLHKLFKDKDQRAGYYATAHNVFFFNKLMEKIRQSIKEDRFSEFKREFLSNLNLKNK